MKHQPANRLGLVGIRRNWHLVALSTAVAVGAASAVFTVRAEVPAVNPATNQPALPDPRDRMLSADPLNGTVPAITKPSETNEIHFESPGVVAQVFVKEGQAVEKDDKIAQQDDRQERAELDALEKDAASSADVDSAKALVDSAKAAADASRLVVQTKEVEVKRLRRIQDQGGGNSLELEKGELELHTAEKEVMKADAEVRKSEADVRRAERDLAIKQDKASKQRFHVENMLLKAKISGIVQQVNTHEGEMAVADPNRGSYKIVKNNPLYVEVNLPIPQAQALKDGATLQVSHDSKAWEDANVLWHAPEANASAGMQTLTLKLDNPTGRSSGMQVLVRLPKEIAAGPREASVR